MGLTKKVGGGLLVHKNEVETLVDEGEEVLQTVAGT